ncbi:MAG TPA: S8 family serine peptidase [Pyrinomonadaceae bacterium]|jgi:subtilisin family serine protease
MKSLIAILAAAMLWGGAPAATAPRPQPQRPKYPEDLNKGRGKKRGPEAKGKLSPELAILFDQFVGARVGGRRQFDFDDEQVRELFNISGGGSDPYVGVSVRVDAAVDLGDLKRHGAKVYLREGDLVLADIPVRSLERLAGEKSVRAVSATKAAQAPPVPSPEGWPSFTRLGERLTARGVAPAVKTSSPPPPAHGLTGKGVIVGIVDTGIDWRHEDFINPDGTSRILYLWDMTDDSFESSGGRVGTRPPVVQEGGATGPGTLYTGRQVTDALRGTGTVNSADDFGHGTAAAGAAAGNGRATANGVPAGSYAGVAPEADLLIVKAGACGSFDDTYLLGTYWIAQTAKQLGRPVVINHSLGGHFSAHDGGEPAEQLMNRLSGAGKPGVAITVAAGNEGRYSLHGSGSFGPRRPGQADVNGSQLEVVVSPQRTSGRTWLNGYFDKRDDWGLVVRGSGNFLVDQIGRPFNLFIYKIGDEIRVQLQEGIKEPGYFKELADVILEKSRLAGADEKTDRLWVPLPPGNYFVWGFGPTADVVNGRFELYMPFYRQGSFTIGAAKRMMVGSPGNAAGVITVGSYDFRPAWENQQGGQTIYNLPLDAISDYSSPGGELPGGGFKPEIAAPARYTISSMSAAADPDSPTCGGRNMGASAGWTAVTRDGRHMAWAGTSAAAPFTAGVIALMLQKNPRLDAAQIKEILIRTAKRGDHFVGPVPNPEWGYGKLNPAGALSAMPRPDSARRHGR